MTELIYIVFFLAFGFGMGWLFAKAHAMNDYNSMYSHITSHVISRMVQAMHSLLFEQEDIDSVIERMGCKVIPGAIPSPPAPPEKPAKKSLEEQLLEKNIGVIYREELTPDRELIMKICLDYADKIKEAATEEDGFLFSVLEKRMLDELLNRSEHQFGSNPVVKITWNRWAKLDAPDYKYIQVEFNLEQI